MWSPVCDVFKEESVVNLMSKKLYLVKSLGYSEDRSILIVAESLEEAKKRVYELEDGQVYSIFPREISEVDGYEIKVVSKEEETLIPDLLPCPFCGGEAIVEEYGRSVFLAKCTSCGIKLPNVNRTKEEAIKAWNTRVGENNE